MYVVVRVLGSSNPLYFLINVKCINYMEIKLTSTENSNIIEVDGRDFNSLSDIEKFKIIENVKLKIKPGNLYFFLQFILENFGKHSISDKPCSQCGDYVRTYTLEI